MNVNPYTAQIQNELGNHSNSEYYSNGFHPGFSQIDHHMINIGQNNQPNIKSDQNLNRSQNLFRYDQSAMDQNRTIGISSSYDQHRPQGASFSQKNYRIGQNQMMNAFKSGHSLANSLPNMNSPSISESPSNPYGSKHSIQHSSDYPSTNGSISAKERAVDDLKICGNCNTSNTVLWRRDQNGGPLCNACGLFFKLHGVNRPQRMKTDIIRKRNRKKTKQEEKEVVQPPKEYQATGKRARPTTDQGLPYGNVEPYMYIPTATKDGERELNWNFDISEGDNIEKFFQFKDCCNLESSGKSASEKSTLSMINTPKEIHSNPLMTDIMFISQMMSSQDPLGSASENIVDEVYGMNEKYYFMNNFN
jgi:hypothetical protein